MDGRLDALMDSGGIAARGNAQNRVAACPEEIPLTEAIAKLNKDVNGRCLRSLFGAKD